MSRFILRRLLNLIPILLGVTFIAFLIISLTPGDFVTTMSLDPQISPQRIAKMRTDFGLDRPWYVQYALWLYRLSPFDFSHGLKWPDLGYSFSNKTPVIVLMKERFVNTLILSASAETVIWLLAIPLGVLAAMKRSTWVDRAASFFVFFGISLPEILLALLALLFAARTGWFPIGGMHKLHYEDLSLSSQIADLLHHLFLPMLVLAVTGMAGTLRYMRGSLLETLTSDYIRTARAKGLSESQVVARHGVRNAVNPLITLFGVSFAGLLSSSFLVEIIMGWPGLGKLTYEAILSKDLYLIMASLIAATTFLIIGNLFADLLLAMNDPRIRYE
ncbi:MAG: ABC transporter substrate-binding protein [Acidobacteria bacterium]|nr:MAG: ABC transporter substrate-binding protein [Acidobacteriota bacterium]